MSVEGYWVFPARVGRNDSLGADRGDLVTAGPPVVGAITENSPGLPAHQQASELLALVRLAWRQHKVHGISVGIPDQVDFGREAAARAPDGLGVGPPFAPAACWWARMTVPSTMTHSQSASPRRASRTLCQTPLRFHRLKRVKAVFQGPKDSDRSRQGTPVLCFQRMASTIGRLSRRGRPMPPCSLGSSGSSLAHIRSVRKVLATLYLKVKPMRHPS
jgi:hypothetical protein